MLLPKIAALRDTRAKIARLEKEIAAELAHALAALPAKYGFSSTAAFTAAVEDASDGRTRRARQAAHPATKRRRKRAVITDATRAKVKDLVKSGKTGNQIAGALKISLPSVQNIKKALGLVKARK
jgi:DNA-binding CsgD family transcriptional regulator